MRLVAASATPVIVGADTDICDARTITALTVFAGNPWSHHSGPDQQDGNDRDQAQPDQRRNWHVHKNETSLEPAARVSATKVGLIVHDHSRRTYRRCMRCFGLFSALFPPGDDKQNDREQAQPDNLGHTDRVQDTHELPPCHPLSDIFLPQSGQDSEGSGVHAVSRSSGWRSIGIAMTAKKTDIRTDITEVVLPVALPGPLSVRDGRIDPGPVFGAAIGDQDIAAVFQMAQGSTRSVSERLHYDVGQSQNAETCQQAKRRDFIGIRVLNSLASS